MGKKAFTLLELVIVIIIVSVLSSLALPKLYTVIERSWGMEVLASAKIIQTNIERCMLMNDFDVANPGNLPLGKCTVVEDWSEGLPFDGPGSKFSIGPGGGTCLFPGGGFCFTHFINYKKDGDSGFGFMYCTELPEVGTCSHGPMGGPMILQSSSGFSMAGYGVFENMGSGPSFIKNPG